LLIAILRPITAVNTVLLRIGRNAAWVALALMVLVILLQVIFRYVFNNALAWPDEAARFLMLWMTGLVAPSAFRWGGFVAINLVPDSLPRKVGLVLTIFLLLLSVCVLALGIERGYTHTMGFGGNFDSASLKLPFDLIGLESIRVKLRYMYGSLLVGMVLLFLVNIELLLRALINLVLPGQELPRGDVPDEMLGAD
jgi:TRAP-type C4-dicarboxylate transport system permease small subunit